MSEKKVVQLTNRNPQAKWKTYNRETGKTAFIEMADMDDNHLQSALVVVQKRKLLNFMMFMKDSKLEAQLKQAAKNRDMNIQDLDYIKITMLAAQFTEFKDLMNFAFQSINRKTKQLEKV